MIFPAQKSRPRGRSKLILEPDSRMAGAEGGCESAPWTGHTWLLEASTPLSALWSDEARSLRHRAHRASPRRSRGGNRPATLPSTSAPAARRRTARAGRQRPEVLVLLLPQPRDVPEFELLHRQPAPNRPHGLRLPTSSSGRRHSPWYSLRSRIDTAVDTGTPIVAWYRLNEHVPTASSPRTRRFRYSFIVALLGLPPSERHRTPRRTSRAA